MQVRYDNYYFTDIDPHSRIPQQRFLPYQPEDEEETDIPITPIEYPRTRYWYVAKKGKKGKKGKKKDKQKQQYEQQELPPVTNVSDISQQKTESNEKLYIGLLIGSAGVFLVALFYYLYILKNKKR